MNPLLQTGTIIVIFALIAYSIAIITEQRKGLASRKVLLFLTFGVLLDMIATTFMVLGSSKGGFTLHGFIGYSSLLGMFIDAVLMWRLYNQNGLGSAVPSKIHLYSRYAYIWWVVAYITGSLIAMT